LFALRLRIIAWGKENIMQTVEEFLAYAIRLEQEAAERFGELADVMQSAGNGDTAKLFRQLSDYSRLHLADAKARSGFRDMPDLDAAQFHWPDFESPEKAAIWAADPMIGRGEALEIALEAEQAGHDFYKQVLDTTSDPEIKVLAAEFVEEEAGHVAELQKWIAAHKAGLKAPA
jgi:rubrerythrin